MCFVLPIKQKVREDVGEHGEALLRPLPSADDDDDDDDADDALDY